MKLDSDANPWREWLTNGIIRWPFHNLAYCHSYEVSGITAEQIHKMAHYECIAASSRIGYAINLPKQLE